MDPLKRVKELMDERGMSKYRLAKESGVPESTVINMFLRNNCPTVPTIELFCKAFNISLAQFFADGQEAVVLPPEQSDLLSRYALLNSAQREYLDGVLNGTLAK